jgi:DNA-directed RNA polymerase specialized sigma24 family protein
VTFDEFAARHLITVRRFATVLTGDRVRGDDLVQEVLVRAHARWRRIGSLDRPEFYIRKMILNEFLSSRRRTWWLIPAGSGTDIDHRISPDHAASHADRDALLAELGKLPPTRQNLALLDLKPPAGFARVSNQQMAQYLGPYS